ncbi:MAG: benzoate-CoA ligase family protein, partial [Rhizobiaceae bacterium]|nr:benzoate-CoA ligase family protein [Rhizobiaceae bacterium]
MGAGACYNAVSVFVDENVAKGFGDKPAFIDPARELTYRELQISTKKIANVFGGLGIKRETRVAMLMFDTVEFPIVFWGSIRAGIVPVCLNTLLTVDQYEYMLADSRVEALFVSVQLLAVVEPLLKRLEYLKHIIVVGGESPQSNYLDYGQLIDSASGEFDSVKTSPDDTAFWLYSSGSTGDPKGTMHVHTSLAHVAEYYGHGVLGIEHDDVIFSAAKLFFAYGLGAGLGMALSVGATTILLPERPTPKTVLATLKQHNATLFFGVPTLYAAMLADPDCTPQNSSAKLRLCISAGEALPAEVGKSWKKRMGIDVIDGIGSTEMLHIFLSNRPDDVCYGTSGKEFEGYKLRLIDEKGEEVLVGEIGELLVCGASAADGYWNQREKSRATFAGIWTHTGDKYFRDEEDYYHYCGRTDDMFKVGGRWVSPFEVEQALVSHPQVLEAAVVAHEDKDALTKPKAFVVLNGDGADDK